MAASYAFIGYFLGKLSGYLLQARKYNANKVPRKPNFAVP